MRLTKSDWIEIFSEVRTLEANAHEMRALLPRLGPIEREKLRRYIWRIESHAERMKNVIQSIIGQLE